jgi:hypothetical protein
MPIAMQMLPTERLQTTKNSPMLEILPQISLEKSEKD